MPLNRRTSAHTYGVSIRAGVFLAAGFVLSGSAEAQQRPNDKPDKAEQQELQALVQLVDAAMSGQPTPADISLSWHNDFLKALEGKTYVPFVLNVDPAPIGTSPIALYLRVVKQGATLPAETKGQKPEGRPEPYPFEDVHFIQPKPPEPGKPHRISRAFAAAAGTYDVYIAVRERPAAGSAAQGSVPKTSVVKQPLTIPDFWAGDLATSTIILADRVTPLSQPPTKDQQAERPYTLGTTEITPAFDAAFTKEEDLSILFLIYNPGLGADKRPDLTVEYAFHQKEGETEKYFNRTEPQLFNSTTLPPQFDLESGHQIVAGQSVPLASFPVGDYRLEIKIADKISGKTLTRGVSFSVAGP